MFGRRSTYCAVQISGATSLYASMIMNFLSKNSYSADHIAQGNPTTELYIDEIVP
jgi:hypothetical protein